MLPAGSPADGDAVEHRVHQRGPRAGRVVGAEVAGHVAVERAVALAAHVHHRGRDLGGVADEPGRGDVAVGVGGGSGLAGSRPAERLRVRAGAGLDDLLERVADVAVDVVRDRAVGLPGCPVEHLAVGGAGDLLHHEHVVVHAAVGDRRVGVGHGDRADGGGPEGDRVVGLEPGCVARDAHRHGTLEDVLRTVGQRLGEVGVRRVDRLLGRREQADRRAVVVAAALALVDHLAAVLEGVRRVAVEGVLEAEAGLETGGQREGLERGARRAAQRCPVQLAVEVVLPGVEAHQGAGLDVHRRGGDVQLVQSRGPLCGHGVLGGLHRLLGEGGLDAEPTGLDLVLVEAEPLQLLLDHGQHEAALSAVLVVGLGLGDGRQLAVVLVGLGGVEVAHRDHAAQHVVVALDQRVVTRGTPVGVEVVGRVQHGGEHRRLGHGQLLGRLAEVGVGRGLYAVRAAAEVDGVQVALEDRRLRLLLLDLQGEERLLHLAGERAFLVEVEDLHVLLGDRRGTLGGIALGVGERRAQDALRVDAAVGVEGAVLRGDGGVLHRLRHVGERDRLTVLLGEPTDLGVAARVVDVGRLGLEGLVGVRDLGVLVGEVEDADQHEEAGEPDDRQPRQDLLEAAEPGVALLLAPTAAAGPVAALAGAPGTSGAGRRALAGP